MTRGTQRKNKQGKKIGMRKFARFNFMPQTANFPWEELKAKSKKDKGRESPGGPNKKEQESVLRYECEPGKGALKKPVLTPIGDRLNLHERGDQVAGVVQ